jgi:hypothetical protein
VEKKKRCASVFIISLTLYRSGCFGNIFLDKEGATASKTSISTSVSIEFIGKWVSETYLQRMCAYIFQ